MPKGKKFCHNRPINLTPLDMMIIILVQCQFFAGVNIILDIYINYNIIHYTLLCINYCEVYVLNINN